MYTFLVFVIVFGGMIFIHEFGHFIVARFFKIPVEEFGFGIPPRAWRFWRNKGHLIIGGKKVVIPSNYDLPFDWQDGLHEEANATADEVNGVLVLRTIELTARAKTEQAGQLAPTGDSLTERGEYQPEPAKVVERGAIALLGVLSEIEPGMEWTINWLPLGGFVRPRGENDPDVPGGLAAVNPWKRLAVLVAGPFMNLLTAVIVFSLIVSQSGIPVPGSVNVNEVLKNSPAEQAGIQMNDIIHSINGQVVTSPSQMIALVKENLDKPVEILLERNGKMIPVHVTPLSSRYEANQGALGVGLDYPTRKATSTEIITGGFQQTGIQALGLLSIPVGLIQGTIAPNEARFVGLKGIYDFFGSAIERDTQSRAAVAPVTPPTGGEPTSNTTPASQLPTNYVLGLIAMLSVSLGVFNLLPIPALDGGRILFTLPEIILRRRIPTRLENTINSVAFLLLIGLMIVVNAMDFINPAQLP